MRCLLSVLMVLFLAANAWSEQPYGIRLDPNGLSRIYPVVDVSGWSLTQPDYSRITVFPDSFRVTHFGDEYYAQDWSRECGSTYGKKLYAGISGKIVMAGWRGSYGNTIVIYDAETKFALKYSHLSEISVQVGDYVLAGKSFLGRVGNTGYVKSTGCGSHPGSHLHLALFKHVHDTNARPITTTYAESSAGPTSHAANFEYTTSIDLVKTLSDPTVYALWDGVAVPVSASSYESHGWNFDKHNRLVRPVRIDNDLSVYSKEKFLLPLRDAYLMKADSSHTVYVFEDQRKLALNFEVFTCRNFRFDEVKTVMAGERDGYEPVQDSPAVGCVAQLNISLADWKRFASANPDFYSPDWSGYEIYREWSPDWGLRSLRFRHSSGLKVDLFRANHVNDPNIRYIGYWRPDSGQWSGWHRVY